MTEPAQAKPSALPGVNVLLMGPSGTGKTHSIGTLVESGLEVFYLALEPGLESLLGYFTDRGKPVPENLHYHKLASPNTSLSDLRDSAHKVNTMSLDTLAKMVDPNRSKHNRFTALFDALNNFPCDRTGLKFGPVDSWDTSRCLIIDSMTGLSNAAMALVVGGKPVRGISDWGIAQGQLEVLLQKLTDGCDCHVVILAHVSREKDEVLGGIKLMAGTLGQALAPKLPGMFSDVILTVREGTKFSWDTANSQADLKTRNLPIAQGITPDFRAIIKKWESRGGVV